jgi:cystathionine beta-lyase/cystathionine gamma-synthase
VSSEKRFETLAIHAGNAPDPSTGAVNVPVYLTSTYVQKAPGVHSGYEYSRTGNPTRAALEANLAALEGADYGLCFSSGCGATSTLAHWLGAGAHMIVADDVYGGTYRLFTQVFPQADRSFDFVDLTRPEALLEHIKPNTRAVWLETPTNPLLKLVDIEAVAKLAHARGLKVIVDNTFMSPFLQQPLALGADVVLHSATKYLGGHSDVVLGAVVTSDQAIYEKVKYLQNAIGATPGPMDCYLALRGTKTLAVRMRQHEANAQELAAWLEAHPAVERVIYPGLASHPQHALAARQCRGPPRSATAPHAAVTGARAPVADDRLHGAVSARHLRHPGCRPRLLHGRQRAGAGVDGRHRGSRRRHLRHRPGHRRVRPVPGPCLRSSHRPVPQSARLRPSLARRRRHRR